MPIVGNFGCEYQRIHAPECTVVNIDVRDNVGADVVCNLAAPLPFSENFFDSIFASHVLEHFSYKSTVDILKEWRRVLKVGGEIEIHVPSFEYVLNEYQKTGVVPLPELYGGQGHNYDIHFICFDKNLLSKCLTEAGFIEIEMSFRDYWGHENLSLVGKAKK